MGRRGVLRAAIMALTVAIAPFSAAAAETCSPTEAKALVAQGKILPMKAVVEKAENLKAGRLLEAELRKKRIGYVYDIEILGKDGVVWELKFNAATGELLEIEEEEEN